MEQNICWKYGLVFIDYVNFPLYKSAIESLDRNDTSRVMEHFELIRSSFDEKKIRSSPIMDFYELYWNKESFDYQFSDLDRCLKLISYRNVSSRNGMTEESKAGYKNNLFHFYLNGMDRDLWYFDPIYYFPVSRQEDFARLDSIYFSDEELMDQDFQVFLGKIKLVSPTEIKKFINSIENQDMREHLQDVFLVAEKNNYVPAMILDPT